MSAQVADPHIGLLSFQRALTAGLLELTPIYGHDDLFAHVDVPEPGTTRLTYVRLSRGIRRNIVRAMVQCIMNGNVDGHPCIALGYAVPESVRNQGLAKQICLDVIQEQVRQAARMHCTILYVEAIVDANNIASQKVAEAVLKVEKESITDGESGLPAYRYTAHYDVATGLQLT